MLSQLTQRFDALRAKRFTNPLAFLKNANALDVRFELAASGPQRVTAAIAKHGNLAAIFTLSHDDYLSIGDYLSGHPTIINGWFQVKFVNADCVQ